MRFIPFILLISVSFASCQNVVESGLKPVVIHELTIKKRDSSDYNKPDSLRNNDAVADLAWPEVTTGSAALKKAVADWSLEFMCGMLWPEIDSSASRPTSVAAALDSFFQMRRDFAREAPESQAFSFDAECSDTTLLNDGKHLTLQLNGYVYAGGAHGNPMTGVATFETATGKKLTWPDLVTDSSALQYLAEKKFREVRPDIFATDIEGEPFNFDEDFPFTLPVSYGLTDKGIYFFYQHYEVTPYVVGTTAFVIPFEDLGSIWKNPK